MLARTETLHHHASPDLKLEVYVDIGLNSLRPEMPTSMRVYGMRSWDLPLVIVRGLSLEKMLCQFLL